MTTLLVRGGLVCASVLALAGCGIAAQGSESGSDESVESSSSALTATQRSNAINAKAAANSALLGPATTSYANTPSLPGGYRHYTNNASVYIGDAVGYAAIVLGLNRGKWAALGWENSVLGFPTTDEYSTAFGTGQYNLFQYGRILWKNGAAQSFETHGCNDDIYGRHGFEWGPLGYPTSDEVAIGDRLKNNFERGRIYTKPSWGGGCANMSWPVLNTTSISNQLAAQGAPRITSLTITGNAIGANLFVQGAGFAPGLLIRFFINGPESRGTLHNGTGATVAANGTFNYSSTAAGDYVSNSVIYKINNVITVQAYHQTSGQSAVASYTHSGVGINYTLPY
jgi:hypothetical protein